MARILVVEDHRPTREFLVQLLTYAGHEVREAEDGIEGLSRIREEPSDLVITDLLMPTMDGYDFVRRLRADPAFAAIPVVFWTASYLEAEARTLASATGVSHVILKPAEPEAILATVGQALNVPSGKILPLTADLHRAEHLRAISQRLAAAAESIVPRLADLIDHAVEIASAREPDEVIARFCLGARSVVGARYATVAVQSGSGDEMRLSTCGLPPEAGRMLVSFAPAGGWAGEVVKAGVARRVRDHAGDPVALGLFDGHPPVRNALAAPLQSATRSYGWILVAERLGSSEFSEEEERLVTTLAALVGRIYETALRVRELEARQEGPRAG